MATPAALYFAGIGTVVGALSLGFVGALALVSTQPVHKEPPAAFAKRDPVPVSPAPIQAAAPETTEQASAPVRTSSFEIVPAPPTKVEEVAGLQFAPPQLHAPVAPAARTIAPDPAPTRVVTPAPEVKPVAPKAVPSPVQPAATEIIKPEPKVKQERRKPTAVAEKKEPARKQYVERRKKQIEVPDDDDDEPIRTTSFASERSSRGGGGESIFGFLFGGN
jgi:hypothetical protein